MREMVPTNAGRAARSSGLPVTTIGTVEAGMLATGPANATRLTEVAIARARMRVIRNGLA